MKLRCACADVAALVQSQSTMPIVEYIVTNTEVGLPACSYSHIQ